ncbi:MAG: cell division protein FtsA [Candidatus Paceibacterota bacterium]
MARHISAGIDIGTYHVKVVVAERTKEHPNPRIIGSGYAESQGMRYGYIINSSDVLRSLKKAVDQAEKSAGVPIKRAFLAIGGVSLESHLTKGLTIISRGDNLITELDVNKVLQESERAIPDGDIINRKVLHTIPIKHTIDKKKALGDPIGMRGIKLEVETLSITCLEQHLNDLIEAVEDIGIQVQDVVAAPLAASLVTLTKAEKIAGCVLVNIGSETVSMVVFEDNIPISLAVFPIGSNDITNDIALGLQVPLEEAEQIKLGGITSTHISRKKLDEIIMARLTDIFEIIEAHLNEIGKNGLLPAGVIITGGGSGVATIEDLAKATLRLPSKIAELQVKGDKNGRIRDASWSVAYGLSLIGLIDEEDSVGIRVVKNTKRSLLSWVRQFLP